MADPLPPDAVVVGVDGSTAADVAVCWAATQARRERLPLVLLHAEPAPVPASSWLQARGTEHREVTHQLRDEGRRLLAASAARLGREPGGPSTDGVPGDVVVHQVVRLADPRDALLEARAGARMLVVGTRGRGRVRSLVLGSVSTAVARHAPCPAVVVRDGSGPGGVVVGVDDGSGGSRHTTGPDERDALLTVAFEVADARSLPVTVLHCSWAEPTSTGVELERLRSAVDRIGRAHPRVPTRVETARGYADEHLVSASHYAALVVVGRRRRPLFGELVHGSVAPVVVEHAACSVAVVPVGP